MGGLATGMMRDDIAPLARFVLREQMSPSPAFDIIYEGYMRRILEQLSRILQRLAGGTLTKEELQVRSIALLGQVFVFRFGHAALRRATQWQSIGESESTAVRAAVLAHCDAIVNGLQGGTRRPDGARGSS